jgi:RNA polymerase sigma-70 factor (ECF subfamily)
MELRRQEVCTRLDHGTDPRVPDPMRTGTIAMPETRVTLLERVRDLKDAASWNQFDGIYRPLIFGYLLSLDLKEHDAQEVTQEVFQRLVAILPTFELDRQRGRFRSYLWRLTQNTLVEWARRRKVRNRAEKEWVRKLCEIDESEGQVLEKTFRDRHCKRILEVVLPQAQATVSPTAWVCFEGRLLQDRPAAAIAAELAISANLVYVNASRVLKEVRRRCAELEGEWNDDFDSDLS